MKPLLPFTLCVALAGAGVIASVFGQESRAVPDPKLTPGLIAETVQAEICTPGYSIMHREALTDPAEHVRYREVMESYHIPRDHWHNYEMDHLVPLCLGGADMKSNLWPQLWAQARDKDREEARICKAVCNGNMKVEDGWSYFLNWGK